MSNLYTVVVTDNKGEVNFFPNMVLQAATTLRDYINEVGQSEAVLLSDIYRVEDVKDSELITCQGKKDECFEQATRFIEGFFYCDECACVALKALISTQ